MKGKIMLLLGLFSPAAFAGVLGDASNFNAFIFENWSSEGGHSDGAVAIGGNAGFKYEFKQFASPSQVPFGSLLGKSDIGLLVGGNLTAAGGPIRVLNGNTYVGGTVLGDVQVNNGYSLLGLPGPSAPAFANQKNFSLGQQAALAARTGVSLDTSDPNNIDVDLSANTLNGSKKVYNLQASQITGLKTLNFSNGSSTDTIIINVRGSQPINWGWQVNYAFKNRILWNFLDTPTINVKDRNLDGTILAPNATVNQYQNIQGNVIAANLNTIGAPELHFGNQFRFDGDLDLPVPEPASAAALALGGLALFAKRRKK